MPAPRLGQHNRELLAEVGIDSKRYGELLEAGVACEEQSLSPSSDEPE
jgi:crotonobetainyl-CoA:carnitine CoA-transferase CaiB-like acyl-CoA transferase